MHAVAARAIGARAGDALKEEDDDADTRAAAGINHALSAADCSEIIAGDNSLEGVLDAALGVEGAAEACNDGAAGERCVEDCKITMPGLHPQPANTKHNDKLNNSNIKHK
jgi:hypothetical protein